MTTGLARIMRRESGRSYLTMTLSTGCVVVLVVLLIEKYMFASRRSASSTLQSTWWIRKEKVYYMANGMSGNASDYI